MEGCGGPDSGSSRPFTVVNADLTYDGVYIDLIEQAMIDAKSEEQQGGSNPDNLELHVVKYNSETGYVDGITATSAGITDRQLSFVYGGVQLDLHFVNDVLIGCRKTMNKSCWIGWKARRWNPAPLRSGRQRKRVLWKSF